MFILGLKIGSMNITLPPKAGGSPSQNIDFKKIVVIGANGSGKTRFGVKIESDNFSISHRISAQKSLIMPEEIRPKSYDKAEKEFLYGSSTTDEVQYSYEWYKNSNRWGRKPNTHQLNDYEKLLVLLHTEEYETLTASKADQKLSPKTKIDVVKNIWETVLPHRKLKIRAGIIESYPDGSPHLSYNAQELSDGERIIFYLIGEALCAPKNSIVIFDEPEMHIHKSLIKNLFDAIEAEREDCGFIYLTHDIDFAFSRENATKIWTKSYNGNDQWDYEVLHEDAPIPEQLYLEILGSRKPVLFLEGDDSSIDYKIFECIYSNYTLKPLGSCERVIQSVKAFNYQNSFHHIESFGIIDRDRRSSQEVTKLNQKDIWVLDVAEAENLFLIEGVTKKVAKLMGKNVEEVFQHVKANVILTFTQQLVSQIMVHYKDELSKRFARLIDFTSKDIVDALSEIDQAFAAIDKIDLYNTIKFQFESYIQDEDYESILRVFNFKNAIIPTSKICELTGIRNQSEYISFILSNMKKENDENCAIKSAITQYVLKNSNI